MAELAVRFGAGVQPGQTLIVNSQIESAPLARAIAAVAYQAGARHVEVSYSDAWVRRARIVSDWTLALFFRRETAQLTSLEHPADDFRDALRAA